MSLYKELKAAGVPMANHYSDLYVPVTPETRAIIRKYRPGGVSVFTNQVEGGAWFDVPFAFEPYWERRQVCP